MLSVILLVVSWHQALGKLKITMRLKILALKAEIFRLGGGML